MTDGRADEGAAALRVLASAHAEIEALRGGSLSPSAARGHILRVANAVDRALRRILRDDEGADLALRLKALAPDELRIDSVLAELRRNERLPMELAAAIHELLETRRSLEGGGTPDEDDAAHTVAVSGRLESAIRDRRSPFAVSPHPVPPREEFEAPDPVAPRRARRRAAVPAWAIGAGVLLALVLVAGIWVFSRRAPNHMEQGIVLFRTGAYEDAASHFWRYAEANPEDATPHLYLARIHRRMDRPELAADALREAQRIAPEDPAVHRETGFLLLDTGRADLAIGRFRNAIERDPDSSEGWVGLIRALRETGRTTEVDAVLEQAPAEVRALLTRPVPP